MIVRAYDFAISVTAELSRSAVIIANASSGVMVFLGESNVIIIPEPGLAIMGFGKRDASFDEGLPQVIGHYRNAAPLKQRLTDIKTVKMMDQHTIITFPTDLDLKVGDIICFAISHPCLTFDKWKTLYLVDEDYTVIDEIQTVF